MDIVLPHQHRQRVLDQSEPLFGIEPGRRGFEAGESLENDPVDLRRRVRRHHRLLDEARKLGRCRADVLLPLGEFILAAGANPRLRDDRHGVGPCGLRYAHGATIPLIIALLPFLNHRTLGTIAPWSACQKTGYSPYGHLLEYSL
jgi:hypothetical protein